MILNYTFAQSITKLFNLICGLKKIFVNISDFYLIGFFRLIFCFIAKINKLIDNSNIARIARNFINSLFKETHYIGT